MDRYIFISPYLTISPIPYFYLYILFENGTSLTLKHQQHTTTANVRLIHLHPLAHALRSTSHSQCRTHSPAKSHASQVEPTSTLTKITSLEDIHRYSHPIGWINPNPSRILHRE